MNKWKLKKPKGKEVNEHTDGLIRSNLFTLVSFFISAMKLTQVMKLQEIRNTESEIEPKRTQLTSIVTAIMITMKTNCAIRRGKGGTLEGLVTCWHRKVLAKLE